MKYKLRFEYDNQEKTARFFYGNLAVCGRYIETYDDLSQFAQRVISKLIVIPGMRTHANKDEKVIKNETD